MEFDNLIYNFIRLSALDILFFSAITTISIGAGGFFEIFQKCEDTSSQVASK